MPDNLLAPHEALELHEIMRSEVICARKLQSSLPLVEDPELVGFMKQSMSTKMYALSQLDQVHDKYCNH